MKQWIEILQTHIKIEWVYKNNGAGKGFLVILN